MTAVKFVETDEPLPDTSGMSRTETQRVLASAAKKGCTKALALLLDSVGSLIYFEARRWTYGALGFNATPEFVADVVSECRLTIFRKLYTYDPARAEFTTFVGWQIKGACSNWVRNNAHTVHIPGKFDEMCQDVRSATNRFVDRHDRYPTDDELAVCTGLSIKKVESVHRFKLDRVVSLDAPNGVDDERTSIDRLVYESNDDETETELAHLRVFMKKLPDRQRYVIENRFGLVSGKPKTLLMIGNEFGVSRERVRQIEVAALRALREIAASYQSETRNRSRNGRAHNRVTRKMAVG